MKQQLQNITNTPLSAKLNVKNIFNNLTAYELAENIVLFLLARIYFMDYLISPFGLSLFCCLFFKNARPYYVIFSCLGALSVGSPIFFFKYFGALLITMSIMLIFRRELKHKKRIIALIPPVAVFLCGIIYVFLEGFFSFDFLLLILECAVLYFSFFVFDKASGAFHTGLSKKNFDTTGLLSSVALVSCAVLSISITKNFWPIAHMLSIFTILLIGLLFGFGMSVPSGAIFGFALSLSTPYPAQMICIYTLSSLASGIFSQFGRLASAFAFAVSSLVTTLILCPEANGILTVSYVVAACLVLFFLPDNVFGCYSIATTNRKNASTAQRIKGATDERITEAIDSLNSVGTIFHEVIDALYTPVHTNAEEIFAATADTVCKGCSLNKFCWQKEREKTRTIANRMLSDMNSRASYKTKDIPKEFADMCIRAESFVCEMSKNSEAQKVTKMWAGKLYDSKRLVAEQFKNISMILKNLKDSITEKTSFVPEAEEKIKKELLRAGSSVISVCVRHNGTYFAELELDGCADKHACDSTIEAAVSEVLEVPMVFDEILCSENICKATLSQKPPLRADAAIAQRCKKNSVGCGDNAEIFSIDSGRVALILADGMGSGKMANFESSIVVKLTKKLLTSGFGIKTCVRLVNDILMTNADKDTFSTIDLCVINLHTGVAEFVKTGSSNSYIKSQNTLDLVCASSLPAGLVESVEPDFDKKHLIFGDYLVMATDGICDVLDTDAGNEIFKTLNGFSGSPQELSDKILEKALNKSSNIPLDDMTVLALKISKNE